jgi:uncharacterized protein (DUF983 family)
LEPVTALFGLGGDATVPLLLGNVLNLYAAIGAILGLKLTVKQVLILAVMLSFSHNLFVESILCRKVGVSTWLIVGVRVGLALLAGLVLNMAWLWEEEPVSFAAVQPSAQVGTGWKVWETAAWAALRGTLILGAVVIPLMVGIQALKDLGLLDRFAGSLAPFLRWFRLPPRAALPMVSGLFAGFLSGAGLIVNQAEELRLSKRELTLIFVFLAACHAVIEDTLVFVPLGVPVWVLLAIRFIAAVVLTWLLARWWKERPVPSSHVARRELEEKAGA